MEELSCLLHGHHASLLSLWREYEERKTEILANKPKSEHAARLRHMQTCTPEMLADLPGPVVKAQAEFDKAWVEYVKEQDECLKVQDECDKEGVEYVARVEYDKARNECLKAQAEFNKVQAKFAPELAAWHERWCAALQSPEGCLWNGRRLVGIG